jgi:hypothetical protein
VHFDAAKQRSALGPSDDIDDDYRAVPCRVGLISLAYPCYPPEARSIIAGAH